ncbi:MAG: site-2 protease family protein [Gammaproteobacteria bacterium]|jgi:Zn-dependent protease|nr:site-2 protease family protein [Gammaproteobacteria bacterium]MBT4607235.1 site-2 protease family protein [Thiotrichales bacterium]MBT3472799.1 site-2 protease family protein [Gammaproteobacteria bacterium]MBT3967569.1 site-2 protease family protein [Gammaproteobacteria bacterium]MBT4080055.1 site-2 protease family protein [Gammaproteobacteria bacterium]
MKDFSMMQTVAIWVLPVLFAITVHEVAHGWVAKLRGDKTAMMMGRLTLNPIKHIDLIGTVALPLVLLVLQTGFVFGWAKPVPVTEQNLRNPKRDMVWVALAGPLSNALMALLWVGVMVIAMLFLHTLPWVAEPLIYMGQAGVLINVVLMVLNLVPLPPLDGGRIVTGLLPGPLSWQFSRIEPYGFVILLALLATGLLGQLLGPLIFGISNTLLSLVGI